LRIKELDSTGARLCWDLGGGGEEENEVAIDGDDWMEWLEEMKDGRGGGSGGAMGLWQMMEDLLLLEMGSACL
jgi:hypothetical protein